MSKCRNCKLGNHLMCIDITCECKSIVLTDKPIHPLRRTKEGKIDPKLPDIEKTYKVYRDMIRQLHKEGERKLANQYVLRLVNELLPETYKIDEREFRT